MISGGSLVMTDQERPVEERNELLDDLLTAATSAAEEPESSRQESQAADEQPESAEQPAALVAEATDAPESVPSAAAEDAPSGDGERSGGAAEPAVLAEVQPTMQPTAAAYVEAATDSV